VETMIKKSIGESNTDSIKYFIQNVELPDIETFSPMDSSFTEFGMVANTGIIVKPSSNSFSIDFLSSEFSLHEHIFYYWLKETTSHHWSYPDRPYTKANLRVVFFDSSTKKDMFSYVLTNLFPTGIETLKPTHQSTDTNTRKVTFAFDNMYVIASEKMEHSRIERAFDKFLGDGIGRALSTGINKKLPKLNIP